MTRNELAMTFRGEGAELGVAAGSFSSKILRNTKVTRLWSVDRWADHHGLVEYKDAAERLARFGFGRCVPLRMTFDEALPLFKDESLQFLYIDGYAHTGQEGGKTLRDWWPKIAPGGIMAGHDYDAEWPKTMVAVDEFVKHHGLTPSFTEGDQYASWWVTKAADAVTLKRPANCPVAEGETVILVGNGPSMVLRGNRGKTIDSFSHVVRFNHFKTLGLEPMVGSKTSLWCVAGRHTQPQDGVNPERVLQLWDAEPREFFNALEPRVRAISQRGYDLERRLVVSSGCAVALWLLEVHGVPQITLAGFDHFSKAESRGHHYWMRRPCGRPRPFKKPKEHDGDAEAELLRPYVESRRIVYLP